MASRGGYVPSPTADSYEHKPKAAHNWKPTVIGRPFLLAFTWLTIVLIITIELLQQTSQRNGGLVFGSVPSANGTPETLSSAAKFSSQYLPTLISVLFGLLWTWIDHDIKRLEPYFQLSKPGGALARDSLLLNYPYSLVASVPISALRRRHWAVFYSGFVLVLIFFVVSPLSSAVFSVEVVGRSLSVPFTLAAVIPAAEQASKLSSASSFVAYDYTYLGAALPPFATADSAILPFRPATTTALKTNETWTGESIRLSADLICTPATIQAFGDPTLLEGPDSWLFTNAAKDCSYNLTSPGGSYDQLFPFNQPYNTLFIGHGSNPRYVPPGKMIDDYTLSSTSASCDSSKHTFLGIWGTELTWNLTAAEINQLGLLRWYSRDWAVVFCDPVYESQRVTVTVQADTGAVLGVQELEDKKPFTALNTTYFGELVSIGVNAASTAAMDVASYPNAVGEYPFAPPDHRSQLSRRLNTTVGIYNEHGLTGFGLAGESAGSLESLLDEGALGTMFARAYRLLFAMAVAGELSAFPDDAGTAEFTRTFLAEAVTVQAVFARLVEGALGVLLLLSAGLIYTTWGRICNLAHEPSSLAAGMTAIAGSPGLIADMADSEWMGEDKLVEKLRKSDRRYHLMSLPTGGHRLRKLNPTVYKTQADEEQERRLLDDEETAKHIEALALDKNASHWELHPATGVSVCVLFLGLAVLLGWLYSADRRWDGLPVIGTRFQNNLLYNYLPTFLAALAEPFWVLITRYTALVMPYVELRRGNASPLTALTPSYDAKPPHFLTYGSLRARHYLLAALSLTALLSNGLAVAFGALFTDSTAQWPQPTTFAQPWSPVLHPANAAVDTNEDTNTAQKPKAVPLSTQDYSAGDIRQFELFYMAFANMSQNLPLPAWTAGEYYFLPFDADPSTPDAARSGETRGFGVDISCAPVPENQTLTSRRWVNDLQDWRTGIPFSTQTVPDVGRDFQFSLWQECPDPSAAGGVKNGSYTVEMYTGNLGAFDQTLDVREGWTLPMSPGYGYIDFAGTFGCPGYFTMGWLRTLVESVSTDTGPVMGVTTPPAHVALMCRPQFRTAPFTVAVSASNNVLSYNRTGAWDTPDDFFTDTTAADFVALFDQMISDDEQNVPTGTGGAVSRYVRNDPRPYDWLNFLMRQHTPNTTWPPDPAASARALEKVYPLLFSIFLQRHSSSLFSTAPNNATTTGTLQLSSPRMSLSAPMFFVALCILALFVTVGVTTYILRPGHFLTHLPTSLGLEISGYYGSNALYDVAGTEAMAPEERGALLVRLGNRYGYGVYVGRDGRVHYGVDREPLVARGGKERGVRLAGVVGGADPAGRLLRGGSPDPLQSTGGGVIL